MTDPGPHPSGGPAFSRRTAVKIGLVGLVGAAVGAGSTAALARIGRRPAPAYRHLTDREAELLGAICGQIIPADDAPGAEETGAVRYIDRQLGGAFARQLPAYRAGLAAFARTCPAFLRLDGAGRIEALRRVERGEAPADAWDGSAQRAFFNLVLAHTMQGFYGSPRHGGNRDYASYHMLGLGTPQVVGRNLPGEGRA